jgi:hypothetical protein
VEEDHQVGDREPAAGGLVARLTEVPLQFGGVGHGEARAVHDEGPVAMPAAFVGLGAWVLGAGVGQERLGQATQQASEDPQGQTPPPLAEGRAGEGFLAAAGHIIRRRVLVEDLEEERMDRVGGVEQSLFPVIILLAAGVVDGQFIDLTGHILPDTAEDANQEVMQAHGRALGKNMVA